MRDRRRVGGVLAAVAVVGAATAGGYAAGSARAPAARHVAAAPAAAPDARPVTYGEAWSGGMMSGLAAGKAAGEQRGRAAGRRRGLAAGRVAVRDTAAEVAREQRAAVREQKARRKHLTGNVLVVGDSLEVLTAPYLQRYLPGVKLTINARGGFSSIQLFGLFQQSYDPAQSVIVFDAGTNDNPNYPQILQSRLAAVWAQVGQRCMVVPTIHGLLVGGVTSAGKNRVVTAFAAAHPGTQVPDWAQAVGAHPEMMQPDNLHPNPRGADYRAQLIAEGVKACLDLQAAFPLGPGG